MKTISPAHGVSDSQVPYAQSVRLHDKLQAFGVDCELCLLNGAEHSDSLFVQPEPKERMLAFMDHHLGLFKA